MAALVSGVALTACMGSRQSTGTGERSTPAPTSSAQTSGADTTLPPGNVNQPGIDAASAAFRDSVHNLTGPEARDNPCYRRLEDYDTVLSELRALRRWLFAATAGKMVSLSDFWGRTVQLQEKHRYIAARFLAACT
jgi:hypothetical protein